MCKHCGSVNSYCLVIAGIEVHLCANCDGLKAVEFAFRAKYSGERKR